MNLTKTFSRLLTVLGAIALILTVAFPPAVRAENSFSGKGNGTTTLSYYVPSMTFIGQPCVEFASVTSDKSSSVLKYYTAAAPITVTTSTNTAQAIVYCVPTTITNNDVVVVRNLTGDTYQRLVVSAATATTLTFTANLANASTVGDLIYKVTAAGTVPVGSNTVTLGPTSGRIWAGQKNRPLLIEVDGTSACAINSIAGRYQQ